jgi:hypothetical protein
MRSFDAAMKCASQGKFFPAFSEQLHPDASTNRLDLVACLNASFQNLNPLTLRRAQLQTLAEVR